MCAACSLRCLPTREASRVPRCQDALQGGGHEISVSRHTWGQGLGSAFPSRPAASSGPECGGAPSATRAPVLGGTATFLARTVPTSLWGRRCLRRALTWKPLAFTAVTPSRPSRAPSSRRSGGCAPRSCTRRQSAQGLAGTRPTWLLHANPARAPRGHAQQANPGLAVQRFAGADTWTHGPVRTEPPSSTGRDGDRGLAVRGPGE